MAHPVAVVFALTMAVWVADVRLTPAPAAAPESAPPSCVSGPSTSAPEGADLEVVVCGSPLR